MRNLSVFILLIAIPATLLATDLPTESFYWARLKMGIDHLKKYQVNNQICYQNALNFKSCIHSMNTMLSMQEIPQMLTYTQGMTQGNYLKRSNTEKLQILNDWSKNLNPHKGPDFDTIVNQLDNHFTDLEENIKVAVEGINAVMTVKHYDFARIESMEFRKQESKKSSTNNYCGIGIVPRRLDDGNLLVEMVHKDSSAESAGIIVGDIIINIDGISINNKSNNEIVSLFRGVEGSQVAITLIRNHKEMNFTFSRSKVEVKNVTAKIIKNNGNKFGYIFIKTFRKFDLYEEFKMSLIDLKQKGAQGIILDLRDNPGGYVDNAQKIASIFIKKRNSTIATKKSIVNPKDITELKVIDDYKSDLPLVILVNSSTCSAAEILAGSLADHGRAILIGTRTFGKGTVLQKTRYPHMIRVELWKTSHKYYLPQGGSLHLHGIIPHIELAIDDQGKRMKDYSLIPIPSDGESIRYSLSKKLRKCKLNEKDQYDSTALDLLDCIVE